MRLSRYSTFWNGGGSLKYRPGVLMTSLTSPRAKTTAYLRWSTTNTVEDKSMIAIKPAIRAATIRFISGSPVHAKSGCRGAD
ncbi:hypothetical protein D3C72_2368010 [compost metagenome]